MNRLIMASVLLSATGSLFLSSCSRETDFYDPNSSVKDYANNWTKQFGDIDPTQDWNVSTSVTASISFPNITGESEARIYSDAPLEDESNLLAATTLTNGTGSITFDALKSATHVFITIKNSDGLFKVYNYYAIENRSVNATPTTAITLTRSGFTRAASSVSIGEKKEIDIKYQSLTPSGYKLGQWGEGKTYEEWKQLILSRGANIQYTNGDIPFEPTSYIVMKTIVESWGSYTQFDKVDFTELDKDPAKYLKPEGQLYYAQEKVSLTLLNGVEQEEAVPCWTVGQGYKLFGPGTFFMEQEKYYESEKFPKLYDLEGLKQVEKGFSIVSEGGIIKMPVVYGATIISDRLGYIYYKDGQDPLTQPHYILMSDARPQSNIYFNGWKDKGTAVGNMQLSNWSKDANMPLYGVDKDTKIYGTTYTLAFFGENHDQPATYDFPAGYHIVFFIAPYTDKTDKYSDQSGDYTVSNYNYSLPELNKRISHLDMNSGNTATYDPNRGAIKSAAWTFNGQTFLGFEDGGGDEDLNDIVFWVQGQYKVPDPPIVVPDPDPLPDPDPESWIIACEDLGNTDDIDFNDIVFSVSHVAGSTTATVTPLAAGGVLPAHIYYGTQDLGEIHELINPNAKPNDTNGQYSMINTYSKGAAGKPITITVPADYSVGNHGFSIRVNNSKESAVTLTSGQVGKAPQMILLPGTWQWPLERTLINEAYPKFGDWSKISGENLDWYNTVVSDKVIK